MLSVGTSIECRQSAKLIQVLKGIYSIIKREENSHANRCIYRLLIIARVYRQHRRSVLLYVCFLWPFEFRSRSSSIYTHCTHPFLIGFCVCFVFSCLLLCKRRNWSTTRSTYTTVLYTHLVRMSIYSVMGRLLSETFSGVLDDDGD